MLSIDFRQRTHLLALLAGMFRQAVQRSSAGANKVIYLEITGGMVACRWRFADYTLELPDGQDLAAVRFQEAVAAFWRDPKAAPPLAVARAVLSAPRVAALPDECPGLLAAAAALEAERAADRGDAAAAAALAAAAVQHLEETEWPAWELGRGLARVEAAMQRKPGRAGLDIVIAHCGESLESLCVAKIFQLRPDRPARWRSSNERSMFAQCSKQLSSFQ